MRRDRAAAIAAILSVVVTGEAYGQSPLAGGFTGAWIEANAFYQAVTNSYGDWSGAYVRGVRPLARDTWYVDALALRAFGESGYQVGVAERHDWSSRFFQLLGANIGSGAAILPRARVDGSLGVRFGTLRKWQATGGVSYVKSVTALNDVAAIASVAWYAPHAVMLETNVRYNVSRPGDIRSTRVGGSATWTPSAVRTFSARVIGGSEGWQLVRTGVAPLTRFQSQELALAWREKVAGSVALSIQGDLYHNPSYTRSGVSIGVARYW